MFTVAFKNSLVCLFCYCCCFLSRLWHVFMRFVRVFLRSKFFFFFDICSFLLLLLLLILWVSMLRFFVCKIKLCGFCPYSNMLYKPYTFKLNKWQTNEKRFPEMEMQLPWESQLQLLMFTIRTARCRCFHILQFMCLIKIKKCSESRTSSFTLISHIFCWRPFTFMVFCLWQLFMVEATTEHPVSHSSWS